MRSTMTRVAMTLIALNALLAIIILIGGEMGETGGRILATSLLATGTALLVMVLVPAVSDGRIGFVPHLAIAGAVVGFVIVTIGIWTETDAEFGWKIAGTAYNIAVAGAAAALLAALPVEGRARWVATATLGAVGIAALMIVAAIWVEIDSDMYWRVFSVLGVLVAAGALSIPILHRSASAVPTELAEETIYHCPFCGARTGPQPVAGAQCPACGRRFGVVMHTESVTATAGSEG